MVEMMDNEAINFKYNLLVCCFYCLRARLCVNGVVVGGVCNNLNAYMCIAYFIKFLNYSKSINDNGQIDLGTWWLT